jgi:hypothetical protein
MISLVIKFLFLILELDCASEEEMAKVLTGGWIIVTVAD